MDMDKVIVEEYTNTKYVKILKESQLNVPGLMLLGRQIRTAATESLPVHEHGACFEIVFICSGSPSFSVNGKTYSLSGGDAFVTVPHELHSTASMPVSVSEMYWFQLDLTTVPNALFLDQDAVQNLQARLSRLPRRVVSMDLSKVSDLLKHAFRVALSGCNPYLTAQYLALLLYLILDSSDRVTDKVTPDIGRTVNYINSHLKERVSLNELALLACLSISQFKQKFKQQIGVSPRQFINTQKIRLAKEMLLEGESISETAAALQFENTSYFITVFKRYMSCTPGVYQRKHVKRTVCEGAMVQQI